MSNELNPNWSNLQLSLFRFIFIYFILYCLPEPLGSLPYLSVLGEYYGQFWQVICIWVGKTVFNLEIVYVQNGSGDRTYDYVLVFTYLCISLIVTTIWGLFDKKSRNHAKLFQYLHTYLRYVLCLTIIGYGTAKIIQAQFPLPGLDRWIQPYGDSSPMRLLWTFMGYSYPFNIFTGLGEMIGGLLLIFKRTTLLGALILVPVLSTIVMLNFCYDVPVKLYSLHLLLITFIILLPDLKRLVKLFLLNKQVESTVYQPLFEKPRLNRWLSIAAKSVVILLTIVSLYTTYQSSRQYSIFAPKSEFYGIWKVAEIEMNGVKQEPLLTNETRWRRVVFDYPDLISVYFVNGNKVFYPLEQNKENNTFVLITGKDPEVKATMKYSQPNPTQLILEGDFENQPFRAKLEKEDKKFLLFERGFNWINEVPFNR